MGQAGAGRTCGNCGAINAPGEQFCVSCGYALAGGPTAPAFPSPSGQGAGARRVTGGLGAGELLLGRYKVTRLVGKGGFAAVYEATDEHFTARRLVAVKEMSDAHLSPVEKAQAIQDFRHEANLLVQLHHPNLPQVSDFFEEAGKAYLVMEFIQGKTLEKEQEDAGGPLDEARVMGYALQLCEVLTYLHTQQPPIIFRDLKPSNVMLTPNDEIKLIDFGIARVFKSAARKDTTSLGSRGYAPLEQYGRGQSDARSDIYALGATLYHLLTGMVPADAATRRVNPLAFSAPRQLTSRLSRATEQIILKAMQEDTRDRFQSAAEMYQAIAATGIVPVTNMGLRTVITPPPPPPGAPAIPAVPAAPVFPPPGARAPVPAAPKAAPTTLAAPTLPTAKPAPPPPGGSLGAASILPPAPTYPAPAPPVPAPGAPAPAKPGVSRRGFLVGLAAGAALVALGGTGAYLYFSRKSGASGAGGPTLTVNFTYSTEKEAWMNAATAAFNQSGQTFNGKTIQVALTELGSVDGLNKILSGAIQPTAWSPASFLELNQLSNSWQAAHQGKDILLTTNGDVDPKSLVTSPLVFAVWKERAQVLLRHYGKIDWPQVHDALTLKHGWVDIGGSADWGDVTFGHTRPDMSNSGLLSVTLLAYAYFNEQRGLTRAQVDDPNFLGYFADIEGAVTAFGRSSGTFLENVVIPMGPAAYSIVTTYENLVLTNQQEAVQRWQQPLQLFYPSLNIVSDHPFAILQGSWVTEEQQMAARAFRDFLLSDDQQRAALSYGFRPANPNVQITDQVKNNPFLHQSPDIQIQAQIQPLAQAPGGDVVDELIAQWKQRYNDVATTTGG